MALTDNLVISLPFNGDWLDKSGNGNDVTPSGIILKSDTPKIGSGYAFGDGINDDGEIANHTSLENISNITVATWIKYTTAGVTIPYERSSGSYTANDWDLLTVSGTLRCQLNLAGSNKLVQSPLTYNDGNWHLAMWSFDQVYLRLFIDNVYVGESGQTDPLASSSDPVTLFARKGKIIPFPGGLDSFMVWGRALGFGGVAVGNSATGEMAEVWNGGAGIEIGDGAVETVIFRRRMEEY
jgi:hypothetical protein